MNAVPNPHCARLLDVARQVVRYLPDPDVRVAKMFLLRSSGTAGRMAIPDVQVALRQEPALFDEWIAALRLSARRDRVREADDLAGRFLDLGMAALAGGCTCAEGEPV